MLRRLGRITIIVIAALVLLPNVASAQESPPEEGEVGNGTAKATALIGRVGPGIGDLELAMRAGLAVTQVTNNIAQSTGQTLDLGLIGTSLTAENCRGNQPLEPEQLPQSTDVDNRDGDATLVEDEGGSADAPLSIGHKDVAALTDPVLARAITTGARIAVAPGVALNGGRAESVTEVLPGEGRQATATVEASIDLGPVTLSGLEWRAYHRTGVDPHAEGTFSIGSATIDGGPLLPDTELPLDELGQLEEQINAVLEPLGVTISFPRVERFLEPADLVRVTPLRISMKDNPVGATLLGPVLTGSQDGRSTLFEAVAEAVCELASVLFVGDIIVSVVAGTGFLTLEVGGAEATSSRFDIVNPFGDAPPPPAVSIAPPPASSPPAAPVTQGPGSTATTPVSSTPSSEVAAPPTEASSASGPLEEFCASVHPNGDSCEEGAALALGLLGVLMTIAIAGYEVRKQWSNSGGDS